MSVGITNVTTHVRYNGFFCWLFDTIGKKAAKNNSIVEQIRFSRRAFPTKELQDLNPIMNPHLFVF